jgi:prepilin-type processing-associated H-X9-DG protein
MAYIKSLWSACSQLANVAFLGGHANESISGRAHREPWPRAKRVINALFFWQVDHCKSAYMNDVKWAKAYAEQHDRASRTT